ncbi:hypothetical protein PSP6_370072 [Paraburkholderia tropica]|nr:hypothetical protein PSP6_370072 [Paraburkholderia tropica]
MHVVPSKAHLAYRQRSARLSPRPPHHAPSLSRPDLAGQLPAAGSALVNPQIETFDTLFFDL